MLFQFSIVAVFLLVAFGFVFVNLLIGSLLRPSVPSPNKLTTYECGEEPVGAAWMNFNIRFYIVALLFIIFDVEIAFMFPVGVVFKEWVRSGNGWVAFAEIFIFSVILLFGLAYVWVKGDLEWVKKIGKQAQRAVEGEAPRALPVEGATRAPSKVKGDLEWVKKLGKQAQRREINAHP